MPSRAPMTLPRGCRQNCNVGRNLPQINNPDIGALVTLVVQVGAHEILRPFAGDPVHILLDKTGLTPITGDRKQKLCHNRMRTGGAHCKAKGE